MGERKTDSIDSSGNSKFHLLDDKQAMYMACGDTAAVQGSAGRPGASDVLIPMDFDRFQWISIE